MSAAKGIERGTLRRMSEVLAEALPGARVCALSGPNLAAEVVAGRPATSVVASDDDDARRTAQEILNSQTFRVYTNNDLVGTELGGALKNIIAIGAGLADGMEVGDNAKAAFVNRGTGRNNTPRRCRRGAAADLRRPCRDGRPHCNLLQPA